MNGWMRSCIGLAITLAIVAVGGCEGDQDEGEGQAPQEEPAPPTPPVATTAQAEFAALNRLLDELLRIAQELQQAVGNGQEPDSAKLDSIKVLSNEAIQRKYEAMRTFPDVFGVKFIVLYFGLTDLDSDFSRIWNAALMLKYYPDSQRAKDRLLRALRTAKAQKEWLEQHLVQGGVGSMGQSALSTLNTYLDYFLRKAEADSIDFDVIDRAITSWPFLKRLSIRRGGTAHGHSMEYWYVYLGILDQKLENVAGYADMIASGNFDPAEWLEVLLRHLREAKDAKEEMERELQQGG